ncbi:hypothetical protein BDW60DRAFT_200755 [Aspergillus nidulans var. acristatus]
MSPLGSNNTSPLHPLPEPGGSGGSGGYGDSFTASMNMNMNMNMNTRPRNAQDAEPTSSSSSLPAPKTLSVASVTVPKSGGAVASIGEKFVSETATGTATLSVPIVTSAGDARGSFYPPLALTYSSGTGNGAFGIGWNVALGAVTRKIDLGVPRYEDDVPGTTHEHQDVFILSGYEDLVPELVMSPDGTWTPLEPQTRSVDNEEYHVYQYRSRVEGAVERIERWTTAEGESHWRTISADNMTAWYGLTPNSRVYDPADPKRVFSWLLCESREDRGNRYVIEYKADDSTGVDVSQANELNRTAESRSAQRYPKRIKYGNRTSTLVNPFEQGWMFEVVFDYGERDAQNPTPKENGDWLIRQDPFSTYRSGFEIRTYRLCQRVLMFHHFPEEPGVGANCLVKSTKLKYRDDTADSSLGSPRGQPLGTFIAAIFVSSHRRSEGGYQSAQLPPVEFTFSRATLDTTIHDIDSGSLENLPYGVDGVFYQFLDLDGEGIQGVLTETADGSWMYKPPVGDGRLDHVQKVPLKPNLSRLNPAHFLMDLDGAGNLDSVRFDDTEKGFSRRTRYESGTGWLPFIKFRAIPNIDWSNPNLRFVDLTGDGRADILITENDALVWYPGFGSDGFGDAIRVVNALDEEKGPRLIFADYNNCIFLADISGDGLVDLVRIRCGEFCYWPNLGYGRFGTKVSMDNVSWLDSREQWNSARVRLADIDGSGTTDLVYLGQSGVSIYRNESGNRWATGEVLPIFPITDNWSSIQVTDFLGNGTACLVWSSPLAAGGSHIHYIDLMGSTKPNLLTSVVNNLGAETRVHYAPSTKFYEADKIAGKPWITSLPFPVQVIERIETYDHIGRTYHSCRYSYHHGYFDGEEREFRGFGLVEQLDTDHFDVLNNPIFPSVPANIHPTSNVPPVLTKTWFHTGVWMGDGRISKFFEQEYWHEPGGLSDEQFRKIQLADTELPASVMLRNGTIRTYIPHPLESREACRAIRGSALRQEIYAPEESEKQGLPYVVSENNFSITMLQPRGLRNRHAVFRAHPRESLSFQYDRYTFKEANSGRILCSPRVSHGMTLELDRFGDVTKAVAINYGQRHLEPDPAGLLTPADRLKQATAVITYQEHDYTNDISSLDVHRPPLPHESRLYDIRGIEQDRQDPLITALFSVEFIKQQIALASDGSHDLPFEDFDGQGVVSGQVFRRLIGHTRTIYQKDDLSGPLPLGSIELLALVFQTYQKAFTPGLLEGVFLNSGKIPNAAELDRIMSEECKYVHSQGDDNWWIPSGRVFYSPNPSDGPAEELQYAQAHFFLPHRFRDQFYTDTSNTESSVRYDNYCLLALESVDTYGNRLTAGERDADPSNPLVRNGVDYRLLITTLIMDPNENLTLFSYEILGMVAGVTVQGKPNQNVGDSLNGFNSDLSEAEIAAYFADPIAQGESVLANATSRIVYDIWAYYRTMSQDQPSPAVAASIFRETHVSDLSRGAESRILQTLAYSDGSGRVIQNKRHVDPVLVPQRDPATGEVKLGPDGQPVMTDQTVNPRWLVNGWTVFNNKGLPVRQYEPFFTDRHAFEFAVKVGVSPILFYDPVGRKMGVLNPDHTWSKITFTPWHEVSWDLNDTILVPDPKDDPDVGDYFARLPDSDYLPTWRGAREGGDLGLEQQQCALKTAIHADTPTVKYRDTIGGGFLVATHNAFKYSDSSPGDPVSKETYVNRVGIDVQGNRRTTTDSKARLVASDNFGMLGQPIFHSTMDAGSRWSLMDIAGNVKYTWDDRGFRFRLVFDRIQRPIEVYQQVNNGPEILFERAVYGDSRPSPEDHNTRMKLVQFFDQAGVISSEDYDFKGNSLSGSRVLTQSYKDVIDWRGTVRLESKEFSSSTSYDALNRPKDITLPDRSIIHPGYDLDSRISSVKLNLQGGNHLTTFISNTEYTAKGQRSFINYGNGVTTTFKFDNLTNRLTQIVTRRDPQAFPNDYPQPQMPDWPGCRVQSLQYTDDPMGNTTSIRDDAQQTIFFRNKRVESSNSYNFDAIYRLIDANGREHLGQTGGTPKSPTPSSPGNTGQIGLAHPNDGRAMGRYLERYKYDSAGNILSLRHIGTDPSSPGWTRFYNYNEPSQLQSGVFNNRLSLIREGFVTESYGYDADAGRHGNITSIPHLSLMAWDSKDQLWMTSKQIINAGEPETTYYVYDSGGQRIRKVTERQADAGTTPTRKSQTVYLGGFEVYTKYSADGNTVILERERLSVSDGTERVAIVETLTSGAHSLEASFPLIRYQISNNLGSVSIELDEVGRIISYEEYTPYGSTSYQAVLSQPISAKKYRYSGKERDPESGFYYHGARYYMPWLGRWVSADPAGFVDGLNLFVYANNNPVCRSDPGGTCSKKRVTVGYSGNPQNEEQLKKIMKPKGVTWTGHAEQISPGHWEVIGGVMIIDKKPAASGSGTGGASEPSVETPRGTPGGSPAGSPKGTPEGSPKGSPEESPAGTDTGTTPGTHGGQDGKDGQGGLGGSGGGPEERSSWSRGGFTLAVGTLTLALGAIILLSNPVGWFALASGVLLVASGAFGVGFGVTHLGLSYSGKATPEEDRRLTHIASTVMTFTGSVGGLVGGTVGYLWTGTMEGLETGAFWGSIAEGVGVFAKGAISIARMEIQFGRGPIAWRKASNAIKELLGAGKNHPAARMRTNPLFKRWETRQLSHVIAQRFTKGWEWFFNRPWNTKLMWQTEHMLIDAKAYRFGTAPFKAAYGALRYQGLERLYHIAPEWMHEAFFGASEAGRGYVTDKGASE